MRMLIMGFGSALIGVSVSWLTGPEHADRLEDFYRRARPPGFWGPIERRIQLGEQDALRRLGRAMLATGLTALSIFCVLVGFGMWLVGSPGPAWMPWREVWIGGMLLMGILLIPAWIFIGFRQPETMAQKR
jgi:solute:Na+ symporter, SSS family